MVGGQTVCGWGTGGWQVMPCQGRWGQDDSGWQWHGDGMATVVACGGAGAGAGSR